MGSHISIVVCPAQNCGWNLAANGILNNISSGAAQCFTGEFQQRTYWSSHDTTAQTTDMQQLQFSMQLKKYTFFMKATEDGCRPVLLRVHQLFFNFLQANPG